MSALTYIFPAVSVFLLIGPAVTTSSMTTLTTFLINMPINRTPAHRQDKLYLLTLICLTVLLFGSTFLGYFITKNTLRNERLKIFYQDAEIVQQLVEERMLAHVTTLRGLQALWATRQEGATQRELVAYVDSLKILT